ncbi:MAG TPA: DUF2851 family protein [Flavobacterium sp.]
MKEDFLHYLWKFKKFDSTSLRTVRGEPITIINSGQYLQLSGPDFFNAQIIIGEQKWAGNIEIHINSSDWYLHHHETDEAYENVILHVVWNHDVAVYNKNNVEIPVLVIKEFTSAETLSNYHSLTEIKSWIYCEKYLPTVDTFIIAKWRERVFFERLEKRSREIQELLTETANDWEAVLFCTLARNFGLNTNGNSFYEAAKSIPISAIRKEGAEIKNLEALLFGRTGILNNEHQDNYFQDIKERYKYLVQKYALTEVHIDNLEFFRHRPDNFPTIRLSQLAQLYHRIENLFSKIIEINRVSEFYKLLNFGVSEYWQTHYQFDRISTQKNKKLSTSFIDLLIVNTFIPIKFSYAESQNKDIADQLIELMGSLKPEKNGIIEKFQLFGVPSQNAFESQSLIQLKNEYCNYRRCLDCAIGASVMKRGIEENICNFDSS